MYNAVEEAPLDHFQPVDFILHFDPGSKEIVAYSKDWSGISFRLAHAMDMEKIVFCTVRGMALDLIRETNENGENGGIDKVILEMAFDFTRPGTIRSDYQA